MIMMGGRRKFFPELERGRGRERREGNVEQRAACSGELHKSAELVASWKAF